MMCLEFKVNGEDLHVAGHPEANKIEARILLCPQTKESWVRVFGDVILADSPSADADWFGRKLAVGDVVTVRVIESSAPEAVKLTRADPSVVATDGIPLACSFCGKDRREVASMTSGKTALICNECVDRMHGGTREDRIEDQMLDSTDDA
jgi:ClpX C4-type zinc finger